MQAVILAAGMGRRLTPVTDNLPKGLLEIGGRPLLDYTFQALRHRGIEEVIMVVGFCSEQIRSRFGHRYLGLDIRYCVNMDYSRTGSMYSLSRARSFLNGDVLLVESDLLFSSEGIKLMLQSSHPDCILTAPVSGSGDEVYICVNNRGMITALGKDLPTELREKAIGELVGISRLSKGFLKALFCKAEDDYRRGETNLHYEECIFSTSSDELPVYAVLHDSLVWTEIDTARDLRRARENIFPSLRNGNDERDS